VVLLPIDGLVPYARNARTHSDAQVLQLRRSMREFGWTNPVLIDEAGEIIAGHARVQAAIAEDLPSIPCVRVDHLGQDPARRIRHGVRRNVCKRIH
jgi:ParB-like chromosome segregation protein Spo0J